MVAALPAPAQNKPQQRRHGFQPGVSGNPGGRPKGQRGLAAYIKGKTRDGREIVEFYLSVMRDELDGPKRVPLLERMAAATWLADRAFGRAVQAHEVTGADGAPVTFTLVLGERGGDADE